MCICMYECTLCPFIETVSSYPLKGQILFFFNNTYTFSLDLSWRHEWHLIVKDLLLMLFKFLCVCLLILLELFQTCDFKHLTFWKRWLRRQAYPFSKWLRLAMCPGEQIWRQRTLPLFTLWFIKMFHCWLCFSKVKCSVLIEVLNKN